MPPELSLTALLKNVDVPWERALLVLFVGMLLAGLVQLIAQRALRRLTRLTQTEFDDIVVERLEMPIAVSVMLVASWQAIQQLKPSELVLVPVRSVILTVAVALWSWVLFDLGRRFLDYVGAHHGDLRLVQPRTLPVFEMALKVVTFGGAAYFMLLAWRIDVTAWMASAGILGVVVGFAAQDTLSNLFAGVMIIADAPYKLGDYLVLDSGVRGRVIQIGTRSTRILTENEVEIIVPNSTMSTTTIINESGGPNARERVCLPVGVSYDSDFDHVSAVLMEVVSNRDDIVWDDPDRVPEVRLVGFGDSSVDLQLMFWVRSPALRTRLESALNIAIYKRFGKEGIEIPYPKRDLYVRQLTPDASEDA